MARVTTTKAKAARASWQERAETWRDKIQVAKILHRLEDCALGLIEMTNQQIKSCEILLNRVMPTLSASEITHTQPRANAQDMLDRLKKAVGDEAYNKLAPEYVPNEVNNEVKH